MYSVPMAHLHKKIKKGRPYYYLREIQRVDGKPKVTSQIYLGTVETIAERFQQAEREHQPIETKSREFGAFWLAGQIEKRLDTIGLIDGLFPRGSRETGPSLGEYFFFAWANRLIDPKSKRALPDWYRHVDVDELHPVEVDQLNSQRYWEKWNHLDSTQVEAIGQSFFEQVWKLQPLPPECLLFDTTNYYTYMASETASDLSVRGYNKAGKHHLRQVGLALLVDRATELPLYYRAYEGNTHDSVLFRQVIDELFGVMCGFNQTKQRLTVVFDKGMNSPEAIQAIDEQGRIHFITTYSAFFVEELASTDLKYFAPLSSTEEEPLQAYRTKRELWGQERTVIVTYNPRTARKKQYQLEQKLDTLREVLLEYRRAYREQEPHWRDPQAIQERYLRECERLHLGAQYYNLEFTRNGGPDLSFRKDAYQISKSEQLFGRNIIVTDNHDWTTGEIVQRSLDRYVVEKEFRASKSPDHIRVNPFWHWTDGKIRCQLLVCAMALVAFRLIEIEVNQSRGEKEKLSGHTIIEEMRRLHSSWLWYPGKRQPQKVLESASKTQAEVLKAFGTEISAGRVLQTA